MLVPFKLSEDFFEHTRPEKPLAYQSDLLLDDLGLPDKTLQQAINRAINACAQLSIPVNLNFRKSFIADKGSVTSSWELSPLACYLTIINCPPANEKIARAQLFFAEELTNRKHGNRNNG